MLVRRDIYIQWQRHWTDIHFIIVTTVVTTILLIYELSLTPIISWVISAFSFSRTNSVIIFCNFGIFICLFMVPRAFVTPYICICMWGDVCYVIYSYSWNHPYMYTLTTSIPYIYIYSYPHPIYIYSSLSPYLHCTGHGFMRFNSLYLEPHRIQLSFHFNESRYIISGTD